MQIHAKNLTFALFSKPFIIRLQTGTPNFYNFCMKKLPYHFLFANRIKPQGWIKEQLLCQADGLSGHLHEFWPDIQNSKWIGGDKEGWERVPYWLDGLIPLAYLLDDEGLKKTVDYYVYSIIARQDDDGWICPCPKGERNKYDQWGIFIILKPLIQYYDLMQDEEVLLSIRKALFQLNGHLKTAPLFDWGKYRWFECLIPVLWLYERQPEPWLLDLAQTLYGQGFDYRRFYKTDFPKSRVPTGQWRFDTHGVNNAMAVKAYALMSLLDDEVDENDSKEMLDMLNKYHGAISGTINADECLAGLSPQSGSELCLVVELMYSLEWLNLVGGNGQYQEQLERIAFNALPSCFTHDMWAHQYDNQVNLPFARKSDIHCWTTNGADSSCFGLEPHYGCCTANFSQGWPKFVISSLMEGDDVKIQSYLPLKAQIKNGEITISSNYPFITDDIALKIDLHKSTCIKLLIPSWTQSYSIDAPHKRETHYLVLDLDEGHHEYRLSFVSKPKLMERPDNHVALVDGPLAYGLPIKSHFSRFNVDDPLKALPHTDYEAINDEDVGYAFVSYGEGKMLTEMKHSPFVSGESPVKYQVVLRKRKYEIKGNLLEFSDEIAPLDIQKEFIPMGVSTLHMVEFKKA